mgnify:CR=1 FL=1
MAARRDPWAPVLEWFATLPMALTLPGLRCVHACWHADSLAVLGEDVVHASPFGVTPLPGIQPGHEDAPHELLLKGFEAPCEPFRDNDDKIRQRERVMWWRDGGVVEDGRVQVFGHYWNMPPVTGAFVPNGPSGHPRLREWQGAVLARGVPDTGQVTVPVTDTAVCVDFMGMTQVSDRACLGALRWPERHVVWACAAKTRQA